MPATDCLAPSRARIPTPGAAPVRAARVRERNQALLLRAAERVFARHGFAGATVADIAREADVPQANLHYYYRTKRDLYRAVLQNILALWLKETDAIVNDANPSAAIEDYVRAKMRFSYDYPEASRVFANEVLHGAHELGGYLAGDLRTLVLAKSKIMRGWIQRGKMAPLDPTQLFFAIWAVTQTYADFSAQVEAVAGPSARSAAGREHATSSVVTLFLRATGLAR